MKENILIVEDEFIVANDLRLMLRKAGYAVCGIAASEEEAKALIEKHHPTWVLLDIFLQDGSLGTDLAVYLNQKGIGFIYISANTNQSILEIAKSTRPYGFLVKPFREKDLLIMLDIALSKHQSNQQLALQRMMMLQAQLKNIADTVLSANEKLVRIPEIMQAFIPFDFINITLTGKRTGGTEEHNFTRTGFDEYLLLNNTEFYKSLGGLEETLLADRVLSLSERQSGFSNEPEFRAELNGNSWEEKVSAHLKLISGLTNIVSLQGGEQLFISFFSRKPDAYSVEHLALLEKVEPALQHLFANLRQKNNSTGGNTTIIRKRTERIVAADVSGNDYEGIVGRSPALLKVLHSINMVSSAPSSVLILGESGTGKEMIAKRIHSLSARKNKPLIVVNCATLPSELIESELFGHEKGAFTGATDKRTGKFELADGGTIFLDEVGELPLESQVKLLRVLQEREFERVGGSKLIKIDVRVIAATNKHLEKEVADGRFRLDLYYRLNVFPVELPPLRERKEDIPLLAQHFMEKLSEKLGKNVSGISGDAMRQLEAYDWPGNIREMEHVMERSLLMTMGTTLTQIMLPKIVQQKAAPVKKVAVSEEDGIKTLEEMEIAHILDVLKKCNGKVCGAGGAAEALGLPPSTLNSKIRKLGIKRDFHIRE